MKKILWISLILLSLLAVLAACTQEGGETLPPMEQGNTEPPTPTDPPDPFSEEEYKAWHLGTALPTEGMDEAFDLHESEGTVYQLVYTQHFGELEFEDRALYRYDSFFTYNGEETSKKRVYFHGDTSLYLYEDLDTEMPFPDENTLVNIQDPAIYGLLEEFVFSLSFEPVKETSYGGGHTTLFITWDIDGTVTDYTIYRDGTVFRNEDGIATQKLPEDVTAAIFAIKYAYISGEKKHWLYADEESYLNPDSLDFGHAYIDVAWDGQERRLNLEESREFLRLLSDPPGEGKVNFGYDCFLRSNCGMGDRGEKLLDFTVTIEYAFRSDNGVWKYSLYEDGKVVYKDRCRWEYRGAHIEIIDRLLVDRYIISRSNFDTQAVLDFLNS